MSSETYSMRKGRRDERTKGNPQSPIPNLQSSIGLSWSTTSLFRTGRRAFRTQLVPNGRRTLWSRAMLRCSVARLGCMNRWATRPIAWWCARRVGSPIFPPSSGFRLCYIPSARTRSSTCSSRGAASDPRRTTANVPSASKLRVGCLGATGSLANAPRAVINLHGRDGPHLIERLVGFLAANSVTWARKLSDFDTKRVMN